MTKKCEKCGLDPKFKAKGCSQIDCPERKPISAQIGDNTSRVDYNTYSSYNWGGFDD